MKSNHKHNYKACLIKQTRIWGHKPYLFWILGEQCTICKKLKYKKYLFFENETQYKLPIVEDKGA